jgi:SAM-dependent methyltransferase
METTMTMSTVEEASIAESPAPPVGGSSSGAKCRLCGQVLRHGFVDLGMSPPCESYRTLEQLNQVEAFYPLRVYVCAHCLLVQLEAYVSPDAIFTEYAYFSSYSDSWLKHASAYVDMISTRLGLNARSQVVEVASNDGYLLQYFQPKGIPALGIEPAANVAKVAVEKGVPTRVEFFGEEYARRLVDEGTQADLIVGNNVLAQVPDLRDFVKGLKILLKPCGVITLEFPHLVRLVEEQQLDTIYHEHFSYFSMLSVKRCFEMHGLKVFDVEELPTHGGSLRVYGAHVEDHSKPVGEAVTELVNREMQKGLDRLEYYSRFEASARRTKHTLLDFLIQAKREGKSIAGYGAPGKGNTLLNYCGIRTDFLDYTVDRNPYKQGRFLPGTHIPIHHPDRIRETRPDYVLILPWNLKDEIVNQLSYIRAWGGRFVVPIPEAKVI